ncbi:hypothetical protein [Rhizobium sp. BK176]|uniref:hypothetical protein n=1 Tax=Rhizobium sp. BK176 TaxID=2587071 RepID=UPI0021685FDA|nr:hypothetical protein [Rhizobium sp. BK176]MCS4088719.1 hypothetical protein [Rhizobium sp. BK176]
MTHNATAPVDAEQSKLAAHAIKKRFDDLNTPIKLNHAYEALAIAHRYPNWATMKASFKVEEPIPAPLPTQFKYGMAYGSEKKIIASSAGQSKHIHAFSASSAARSDLLVGLSRNAIENGSGLFFFHAVARGEDPSAVMMDVMNLTVHAGRRREFFVIDASRKNSRLGNSCNILAAAESAEEIAELFWVGNWHMSVAANIVRIRGILTVAARHALRIARSSSIPMTSDLLVQMLGEIQVGSLSLSEDDAAECEYNSGPVYADLCRTITTYVERQVKSYPMFFDNEAQWNGIQAAANKRQIVVVLVSWDAGDDVLDVVGRIAFRAIKRTIAKARPKHAFPDMVVFNDVGGFDGVDIDGIVKDAGGVVVCVGDQCPSPPAAFAHSAAIYRSFGRENDSGRPSHYLEVDGKEVPIHTNWS